VLTKTVAYDHLRDMLIAVLIIYAASIHYTWLANILIRRHSKNHSIPRVTQGISSFSAQRCKNVASTQQSVLLYSVCSDMR